MLLIQISIYLIFDGIICELCKRNIVLLQLPLHDSLILLFTKFFRRAYLYQMVNTYQKSYNIETKMVRYKQKANRKNIVKKDVPTLLQMSMVFRPPPQRVWLLLLVLWSEKQSSYSKEERLCKHCNTYHEDLVGPSIEIQLDSKKYTASTSLSLPMILGLFVVMLILVCIFLEKPLRLS